MRTTLSAHYGQDFVRISLALYRGGDDSVAWHGDSVARADARSDRRDGLAGRPTQFLSANGQADARWATSSAGAI